MADVTISQFADVLKVPVDRLIAQLDQAGITVSSPEDMISEDAKLELLTHLRRAHGSGSEGSAPNRITLKRKTQSELRLSSNQGRARTVNVEVRQKRTYIKRDVLEGQARAQQEQLDAQKREAEEAQRAQTERVEAGRPLARKSTTSRVRVTGVRNCTLPVTSVRVTRRKSDR
jgi:translation initiation factor IF-2